MIVLMGIQGSGKGTQGAMLADNLGYKLLSMGDIIRAGATDEQRERMLKGELLHDDEATAMIDQAINDLPADQDIILDGYPRSISQAEWLCAQADSGRFGIEHVINLTASRHAVMDRLLGRGRADDNEAAIAKRLNEYDRATTPLIDWFNSHGLSVENINAEQSIEAVNENLVKLVNEK
jgi:adenylate kinase